jgi:hypothetical protein
LLSLSPGRAFWLVASIATAARLVMVWTGMPETHLPEPSSFLTRAARRGRIRNWTKGSRGGS